MNHTGFCVLTRQQYEWTAPGDSVVSEYNLVCGQAWQVSREDAFAHNHNAAALNCLQACSPASFQPSLLSIPEVC